MADTGIECTFGSNMKENLDYYPLFMVSQYLKVVPLFLAILVLGKAIGGSKFTFVYLLAGLSLIDSIANLVFDSTFICFYPQGPDYDYYYGTGTNKVWQRKYIVVHALSNIHNYIFIFYNFKLRATR